MACCGGELKDQTLIVTGAGVTEVNGSYSPNGEYDGEPAWINKVTNVELWRNHEWRIGTDSSYYYVSEPVGDGQTAQKFIAEMVATDAVPLWRVPNEGRSDRNENTKGPVPTIVIGKCGGWCCGVC